MTDSLDRLGVSEVANRLGVHTNTIRNWVRAGLLHVEHLPGSGYIRVPLAEVELIESGDHPNFAPRGATP